MYLIDEARTPLIISGPAQGDLEWYGKMAQIVKQLKPEDYEVNEKDRGVSLTEVGIGPRRSPPGPDAFGSRTVPRMSRPNRRA